MFSLQNPFVVIGLVVLLVVGGVVLTNQTKNAEDPLAGATSGVAADLIVHTAVIDGSSGGQLAESTSTKFEPANALTASFFSLSFVSDYPPLAFRTEDCDGGATVCSGDGGGTVKPGTGDTAYTGCSGSAKATAESTRDTLLDVPSSPVKLKLYRLSDGKGLDGTFSVWKANVYGGTYVYGGGVPVQYGGIGYYTLSTTHDTKYYFVGYPTVENACPSSASNLLQSKPAPVQPGQSGPSYSPGPAPNPTTSPGAAPQVQPPPLGTANIPVTIEGTIQTKNISEPVTISVKFTLTPAKGVVIVKTATTTVPPEGGALPPVGATFEALPLANLQGRNTISIVVTATAKDLTGAVRTDTSTATISKDVDSSGTIRVSIQPVKALSLLGTLDGSRETTRTLTPTRIG